MAGIGFELKKLFSRKGLLATLRAYGYAGIVCTGPMLLGVTLLLGVMFLARWSGAPKLERDLLVSMITYALLGSLTVTSFFSMLTTRYVADLLYMKKSDRVMGSFYGSLGLMLVIGGAGYGIFLFFSGICLVYQVLSWLLFMTLLVTWTEINYLTAIKDYRTILLAFAAAIAVAFVTGFLLLKFTWLDRAAVLLFSVWLGYGVMAVWYFNLLCRYFPESFGSSMSFLRWADEFPHLALVGAFTTFGLFGHLLIMWASPLGEQIQGLFYGAPAHDVSALVAFFSILITTVNFVTSVEVRFYPQYRNYFSLFNDGGCIGDIDEAEDNMLRVLKEELGYLAQKQLFATLLFIILGTLLLPRLPLGFTTDMLGLYRVLCVGYALYAIGNSIMLIQLYFADNKGAFMSALAFALAANLFTLLAVRLGGVFYGFGLAAGGLLFCTVAYVRLNRYLQKLKYHILSEQPLYKEATDGIFTRLCGRLDRRAEKKQRRRREKYLAGKKRKAVQQNGISVS